MKSPVSWIGGKYYIADWIVSHFSEHDSYVEPFAGGLHVLCAKSLSKIEVINDINSHLINFYLMAHKRPDELMQRLDSLPYSREIYELYNNSLPPEDEMERAVWYFYLVKCAWNKMVGSGWVTNTNRIKYSPSGAYYSAVSRISWLHDRLKKVMIENKDYKDILSTCQLPRTKVRGLQFKEKAKLLR